jgi:hypothetical protein
MITSFLGVEERLEDRKAFAVANGRTIRQLEAVAPAPAPSWKTVLFTPITGYHAGTGYELLTVFQDIASVPTEGRLESYKGMSSEHWLYLYANVYLVGVLDFLRKHTGGLSSLSERVRTALATSMRDAKASYDVGSAISSMFGTSVKQSDPQALLDELVTLTFTQRNYIIQHLNSVGFVVTLEEYAVLQRSFGGR